jgi:hypothetical protein
MLSREKKCSILGELWAEFREDQHWAEFFRINDVALPLSYGVKLGYVKIVRGTDLERFIDETWNMFCEFVAIDARGDYASLSDAYRASDVPPLKFPGETSLTKASPGLGSTSSGPASAADASPNRFCTSCGAARTGDARFCTECGSGH